MPSELTFDENLIVAYLRDRLFSEAKGVDTLFSHNIPLLRSLGYGLRHDFTVANMSFQ